MSLDVPRRMETRLRRVAVDICRCSSSLRSSQFMCNTRLRCLELTAGRALTSSSLHPRSNLDTAGKESVDRQDVATSLASQGVGTYDQVRETLKEVQVDAT